MTEVESESAGIDVALTDTPNTCSRVSAWNATDAVRVIVATVTSSFAVTGIVELRNSTTALPLVSA